MMDRVGTDRADGARFYPYGEEIGSATANDRTKFATYNRDGFTGLDYADQRYYSSSLGRFGTTDPMGHANLIDSQSFNQYSYVGGDPINASDPRGLCAVMASGITMGPGTNGDWTAEAGLLGADAAYPYQGEGAAASVASVASQALFGPNDSTQAVYNAIKYAISSSSTPVDLVAYSGGAGALTAAWNLLSSSQKSMVGNILYISPGAGGAPLATSASGQTNYVFGSGAAEFLATFGNTPVKAASITQTNCDHTDLACLFNAASGTLAAIQSNGSCSNPKVFTRTNPSGVPGIGIPWPAVGGGSSGGAGAGMSYWQPVYYGAEGGISFGPGQWISFGPPQPTPMSVY
jgi:RHS repeat-associated protein